MKIVALETGLFPDRDTVEAAIGKLEAEHEIERIDASDRTMTDADWDRALAQILRADLVVTT